MSFQIIINISITFSLYLIVALSFHLVYVTTKFFHIAHASVISFGAYFTYYFAHNCGLLFLAACVFGVTCAIFIGLFCELLIYKALRRNKASALSLLVVSLGINIVLQNTISIFFGDTTLSFETNKAIQIGIKFFNGYVTIIQVSIIIISLILYIGTTFYLNKTLIGKSIRAVGSNSELCNIYGVNSERIIFIVFFIASALGATAGILLAEDTSMTPAFGFNFLLFGVVSMIIGGIGSNLGLIFGALFVAVIQHMAAYCFDTKWMNATAYLLLILFLIWKPFGFSGHRLRKVEI